MAETKALPRVEANIFLLYPTDKGDVSVHFKLSTDGPDALDDVEAVIKEKVGEGPYKPDAKKAAQGAGFGGGARSSGSGFAGRGSRDSGGEKPTRFQDDNGTTWYVNDSKKKPGQKYIGRKGQDGYEYMDWEDAPDYIRQAYGK